jgi:hypothetical protein
LTLVQVTDEASDGVRFVATITVVLDMGFNVEFCARAIMLVTVLEVVEVVAVIEGAGSV